MSERDTWDVFSIDAWGMPCSECVACVNERECTLPNWECNEAHRVATRHGDPSKRRFWRDALVKGARVTIEDVSHEGTRFEVRDPVNDQPIFYAELRDFS